MKALHYYRIKTVFGFLALVVFIYMYICNPENLNFTSSKRWFGVDIFWCVLFVDLLWRFIPGKFHHIGQQKYLKCNFEPSKSYEEKKGLTEKELQNKKKTDKRALNVALAYGLLNLLWFVLYFLGIFRPQELFGIMLLYFVGDMICVHWFCPFRTLFLKNRCCNVCRIYNWDSIMLVFPLLIVPCLYSWILGGIAVVYTIVWEVSYYKHPERFYGSSNARLNCDRCDHGMCPHRKK